MLAAECSGISDIQHETRILGSHCVVHLHETLFGVVVTTLGDGTRFIGFHWFDAFDGSRG